MIMTCLVEDSRMFSSRMIGTCLIGGLADFHVIKDRDAFGLNSLHLLSLWSSMVRIVYSGDCATSMCHEGDSCPGGFK